MKANNVIIFMILFLSSVSYCFADMKILKINQSHYMSPYNKEPGDRNLCNKWVLNASQIEKIFSLSDKYKKMSDTMTGFWLWFPCEITGELIYNKKKWHFLLMLLPRQNGPMVRKRYTGGVPGKNVMTCLYFHIQAGVI